jgi:hypothetical protein
MKITRRQLRRIVKEAIETTRPPRIFVLVGPPSVGKSTWIKNTFRDTIPYVINRDDIVEQVASTYGWTYDDMFVTPPEDATIGESDEKYGEVQASPSWMTWAQSVFSLVMEANGAVQSAFNQRVSGAVPSGLDVIVDMTNMNAAARARALNAIEGRQDDYEKIAVDFKFEGAEDVIMRVAQKRAEAAARMGKSKTIPPAAMQRMMGAYEAPSLDEGFDSIVEMDNREILRDLADQD